MRKSWIYLITNFIVISLIQLMLFSCAPNKSSKLSPKDLTEIKECLSRTIIELNHEKSIKRFKLNIKSVKGTWTKEDEKIFFLGDWVIEVENNIVITHCTLIASSHEDKVLFIEMKKLLNNYTVEKWYVKCLIFN